MEPDFPDESIAFVNHDEMRDGDIGVFCVDGATVIKQWHYDRMLGITYLFSLNRKRSDADLVITGEGRLDGQTVMGKAPVGVARIAKEFHKPVLAFSGSVTREAAACNDAGIDAFFPILRSVVTLEEAMDPENARKNMADTAEQVFRLVQAVQPMQAV